MFEGPGGGPEKDVHRDAPGRAKKRRSGSKCFGLTFNPLFFEHPFTAMVMPQWHGKEILMTSGGSRARSGPAPDPDSYRSQSRDWIDLPAGGFAGDVPGFPLSDALGVEVAYWAALWRKPQAAAWLALGLEYQVAAYARAFIESTAAEASAGLKTAVLRMETELGISVAGMKQNLWRIGETSGAASTPVAPTGKRQTTTGSWLKGVNVEGS